MKALIVIDMPKTCAECRASYCTDVWYCYGARYRRMLLQENIYEKPNWCPLKPMPQEIHDLTPSSPEAYWKQTGRNELIRELLGETDEEL